MNRDRRRLGDYLEHVLEAIDRIQRYVAGMDERAFEQNGMAQDAVIRNFEIIGEASHNIETHFPEFAAAHPDLPLAYAYQMRNAVAHGSRAGDDSVSSFRRRPESRGFQPPFWTPAYAGVTMRGRRVTGVQLSSSGFPR